MNGKIYILYHLMINILLLNKYMNDTNENVSTLRQFSIISLLSNIILHRKYTKLLANLLSKYPFLLYYKTNILWSVMTQFCNEKLKVGIQRNEARAISILISIKIIHHSII